MKTPPSSFNLLVAVSSCALLVTSFGADWSQWRGPNRNGTTSDTGWTDQWSGDSPKTLWKRNVGTGCSSMAVVGDRVYTLGNKDGSNTVWCLDRQTGQTVWQTSYKEDAMAWQFEGGPTSTPLYSDGALFTAGRSGTVHCLNATNGEIRWTVSLPRMTGIKTGNWGLNSSPLVREGRLLLNWGTAGIALDPADGTLLWLSGNAECSYTSLVPGSWGSRKVLFSTEREALTILDPATGSSLWREPFRVGFKASDPTITPDGVFYGALETGGVMVRLDGTTPQIRWKNRSLGTMTGGAVFVEENLYAICSNNNDKGELKCIDPATGRIRWSRNGMGWGSLIASGNRILVLTVTGELQVIKADPSRCDVLATAQILGGKCWTMPALADGRLYARNARGDIACFDLRSDR